MLTLLMIFSVPVLAAKAPDYGYCFQQTTKNDSRQICVKGVADPLNSQERGVYNQVKTEMPSAQFSFARSHLVDFMLDLRSDKNMKCVDLIASSSVSLQCQVQIGSKSVTKTYPWLSTYWMEKHFPINILTAEEKWRLEHGGNSQSNSTSTQGQASGGVQTATAAGSSTNPYGQYMQQTGSLKPNGGYQAFKNRPTAIFVSTQEQPRTIPGGGQSDPNSNVSYDTAPASD